MKNKIIYLDYNATTPVDPYVLRKMEPFFDIDFGNPSSLHWKGQIAKKAVNKTRKILSSGLGCLSSEIIFTSGATEAINLAIKGIVESSNKKQKHIITLKTEHKAVLDSCNYLESKGIRVDYLPVDKNGFISPSQIIEALNDDTVLVAILHGNNEIGTIQPINKIGDICKKNNIPLFVDAAQTFGKIPINVKNSGISLLSGSAHKIYGPKGVGFLYKSNNIELEPLIHGGGHERGYRSGTLNVSGIVGLGEAFKKTLENQGNENKHLNNLICQIDKELKALGVDFKVNGPIESRLPGNINICFSDVDADWLTTMLPSLAFAKGSACTSETIQPSHVLRGIGLSDEDANSSIRISVGRFTTKEDISIALTQIINKIQYHFTVKDSLAI